MTRFLAAIFVTLVAASAPFAPTAIAQSKAQEAWQRVDGEVELKEADALRSAEDAAARLVWEQLGEHWLDVVGPIVPRERAKRELERWLRAEQIPGPALRLLERELFTSSVGTAYRQESRWRCAAPRRRSCAARATIRREDCDLRLADATW
jgi:hypothetical protein